MVRKNFNLRWTKATFVSPLVSSPNHISVSCQHITIKVSKRYWFQGSFSSGLDNFSPAGLFQKLAKPCKGGWPCIDGFGYDFRVLWGGITAKCLMATFCLAKMKEKTYMFNEKNAIDQGILATSKTLTVSNAMYLFEYRILNIEVFFCSPHADHWGNSHHILESTFGSSKVSLRGLIPFSNNYHERICTLLFENNRYKSLALNMWILCQHQNIRPDYVLRQ